MTLEKGDSKGSLGGMHIQKPTVGKGKRGAGNGKLCQLIKNLQTGSIAQTSHVNV